jgi:hypothetical protein
MLSALRSGTVTSTRAAERHPPRAVEYLFATTDRWTISHFAQSNPSGPGQGDVAALLRRVADSLDELGDVTVQDSTFHAEPTAGEDDLTMTVYYHARERRR